MTRFRWSDAAEDGTGHQLDLIALRDELEAIRLLADGAGPPTRLIAIAAVQLKPTIGVEWAKALEDAARTIGLALAKTVEAAARADERSQHAMQAGEHFLAYHKDMERDMRQARRRSR